MYKRRKLIVWKSNANHHRCSLKMLKIINNKLDNISTISSEKEGKKHDEWEQSQDNARWFLILQCHLIKSTRTRARVSHKFVLGQLFRNKIRRNTVEEQTTIFYKSMRIKIFERLSTIDEFNVTGEFSKNGGNPCTCTRSRGRKVIEERRFLVNVRILLSRHGQAAIFLARPFPSRRYPH